jgi:hypothetical protein
MKQLKIGQIVTMPEEKPTFQVVIPDIPDDLAGLVRIHRYHKYPEINAGFIWSYMENLLCQLHIK